MVFIYKVILLVLIMANVRVYKHVIGKKSGYSAVLDETPSLDTIIDIRDKIFSQKGKPKILELLLEGTYETLDDAYHAFEELDLDWNETRFGYESELTQEQKEYAAGFLEKVELKLLLVR